MKMKPLAAPWRWWTWLYTNYAREVTAGIALLVVVALSATVVNNFAIGRANASNAVTNCENANESRKASRTLWNFILNLSTRDAPPESLVYLDQVREWIGQVYQPHDCANLDNVYKIPPPPSIPAQ